MTKLSKFVIISGVLDECWMRHLQLQLKTMDEATEALKIKGNKTNWMESTDMVTSWKKIR